MKCSDPYIKNGEFRCGRCLPCRIARKRLWTARLILEMLSSPVSLFVTLTYRSIPESGSVSVRDAQLFLKRVRERITPSRLRYYIVGEYGDVTGRAHYHVLLFGNVSEADVRSSWPQGFVYIGSVTPASAAYVVSYVVKGLTSTRAITYSSTLTGITGRLESSSGRMRRSCSGVMSVESKILNGLLAPEFARMSLKPGIGAVAAQRIAQSVLQRLKKSTIPQKDGVEDVPSVFRYEAKLWAMGRYLRSYLRKAAGIPAGMPVAAQILRSMEFVMGDPFERKAARIQDARKAFRGEQISRSRKGLGI